MKKVGSVSEIKNLLAADKVSRVMVIGAADSGKSTLIEELAVSAGRKAALVDGDPGQSRIGAPATVSWAFVTKDGRGAALGDEQEFYFIGSTSPIRHFLPSLVGIGRLCARAELQAGKVFIDTSGFIAGPGVLLKQYKIELIRPDLLIMLERENELDKIAAAYRNRTSPIIVKLPVLEKAVRKSVDYRGRWRENAFKRYFASGREIELKMNDLSVKSVSGTGPVPPRPVGLLSCFEDGEGKHLALGIVETVDRRTGTVTVFSPLADKREARGIIFGSIRISRAGEQISY